MPVNSSYIATQDIRDPDSVFVIELVTTRPVVGVDFTPTRPPGQLLGFYNGATNVVELYVVNSNGNRFYRTG